VLLRWPLVLQPVHVVFLELIIDPACSVVFEAEKEGKNIMNRPPRSQKEPLFGRETMTLSLLQGLVVFMLVLTVFVIALQSGHDEREARTMAFITLIAANLSLILTNRSWTQTLPGILTRENNAFWAIVLGASAFLTAALTIPFLRNIFLFTQLDSTELAICLSVGVLSILWFECYKAIKSRVSKR
jgi:P-type Ca2+ transporter type 2C